MTSTISLISPGRHRRRGHRLHGSDAGQHRDRQQQAPAWRCGSTNGRPARPQVDVGYDNFSIYYFDGSSYELLETKTHIDACEQDYVITVNVSA